MGAAVVEAYRSAGANPLVWDIAGPYDIECDISDPTAINDALIKTRGQIGVPEHLTITAGIGHGGVLLDEAVEDWDRVIAVNTRGPMLVMRAVARALIEEKNSGSLIATSSVSAHLVDRAMVSYCASKAALNMVIRVAACEWAPFGIRVNAVGPGVTETPMLATAPNDSGWLEAVKVRTPLGRLGLPIDIAQVILAMHQLPWVTGQILDCDGGLALHSPIDAFGEAMRLMGATNA